MSRQGPLSFEVEGFRRWLHGMDRRIKDLERGGDWNFDDEAPTSAEILAASTFAQLVTMSATGVSLATGGDAVTFDSLDAQQGFADVAGPGASWTHTIGGVYMAIVKLEWATYTGGGTIRVRVNGVSVPEGLVVSGTSGSEAFGVVSYRAEAGSTADVYVTQSSGSAQTCDVSVTVSMPDPNQSIVTEEAVSGAAETFWLDSRSSSASSTMSLTSGQAYTIRVTGNFDIDSDAVFVYDTGTPDSILFPSPGKTDTGRGSVDWDVWYATDSTKVTGTGHTGTPKINLGSGAAHREPRGGPYSSPVTSHQYLIDVTGQGSPITVGPPEAGTLSDNNGQFKFEIFEGTL